MTSANALLTWACSSNGNAFLANTKSWVCSQCCMNWAWRVTYQLHRELKASLVYVRLSQKGREGGRKKDRSYTFPVLPPLWNIHKGFQTLKELHLLSFSYILQNTFYILKFICVSWLPSDYELSLTLFVLDLLILCVQVFCLHVCLLHHMHAMPVEAWRGRQNPWGYRGLLVSCHGS